MIAQYPGKNGASRMVPINSDWSLDAVISYMKLCAKDSGTVTIMDNDFTVLATVENGKVTNDVR